jgi:hypothetical protein
MASRSNTKSASNSNEEQTSEMIANLTMTQLLFILQRIRQLSFHSQEYSKKLLSESPQLSLALIHALYTVSGKKTDFRLLPLTPEEIKISRDRMNLIRLMDANPSAQVTLVGKSTSFPVDVGLSKRFQSQHFQPSGDQAHELSKLLEGLDPSVLAKVMESVAEGQSLDSETMVETLLNLSPEQISVLPEAVQRQVLKLLEESLAV